MGGISTHILDTAAGRPAAGVAVALDRQHADGTWHPLARATTDDDGRVAALLADDTYLAVGNYRLVFAIGAHFGGRGFHPEVTVAFSVTEPGDHHHVPLLVSPFGYTTYRGS